MQAAKIKIGECYAVQKDGRYVYPVRVSSQHTIKTSRKTTNHFAGARLDAPDPVPEGWKSQVEFEASEVLMPLEEHEELMRQKKEREDAAQAKADAEDAERDEVIALLAELTGFPVPQPGARRWDKENPSPFGNHPYGAIEISQEGLAALKKVLLTVKALGGAEVV